HPGRDPDTRRRDLRLHGDGAGLAGARAAARVGRHCVRGALGGEPPGRAEGRVIELDIELAQGSFLLAATIQLDARAAALFGPSGAGKTTILDAIAGLRAPRRGRSALTGRIPHSP